MSASESATTATIQAPPSSSFAAAATKAQEPASLGSTPSQRHPNPLYPDSAEQGFADVSHGISLPSDQAGNNRGGAASGTTGLGAPPYKTAAVPIGAYMSSSNRDRAIHSMTVQLLNHQTSRQLWPAPASFMSLHVQSDVQKGALGSKKPA